MDFSFFENSFKTEPDVVECIHDFRQGEDGYVCSKCYQVDTKPIFALTYEQEIRRTSSSPYKRRSHFQTRIWEIQGLNRIPIPPRIYKMVENCMNSEDIKTVLQKNGEKLYYGQVFNILRDKGVDVPYFTQEELKRLYQYFATINSVYDRIKENNNLLNYHFILRKLCVLIGREDMLDFLFKLRSKRKLGQYSRIWNKIGL
jgi:hypothetical protein